jgi:hypothetical protein
VAIVFHAHLLSPFRFYADMNRRRSHLWENGVVFPLERLASLIEKGIWSDEVSQQEWMGNGKSEPYQLWSSDPFSEGQLHLQDIPFTCPWCTHSQTLPLPEFTSMHTTKSALCRCGSCGHGFNADTLSAKYLVKDLLKFFETQNGWYSSH